jgi:iron complex outermembrane receptor protein
MKNDLLYAAAAAFTLGCCAQTATAQSIDYGSLQQLFNEPVTTSATGAPLRVTEVPVDMTIITADEIKRSGATDLPTILSRVPGIDILNWGAGDSDVGVRGYNQAYSPRLLVLIDGREVYLDDYGYTAWANLPVELSEIRQIEVVRGPNSALFGFNAVGGVINIITFNPKYDNTNSIDVHGGTQNDVGGSVVQTLHLGDRVSVRASAGGERQSEWKNATGDPMAWSTHSMVDMVAQLAPKTEFRLEGSWSRSAEDDLGPGSNTYALTTSTTTSIKGSVNSDTPYGEIQAQAYLNDLEYVASGASLGTDFKNQIEVVSLQDLFKIGARSTFRIALEYRDNLVNTQPLNAGHIGYSVVAPSAMWNFAATSKLALTAAARLDALDLRRTGPYPSGFPLNDSAWSRTTNAFSANLGAVYKLTSLDTLRVTYGRGIQVPTLLEFGGLQFQVGPAPFGESLGGNPNLKPAVVSNYELSYSRVIQALNATASAKVFFQQTDDVKGDWDFAAPSVAPTLTTSAEALTENASSSQMTGFELSASGKVKGGFHWNADTTYTNVTDKAIGDFDLVRRDIAFAETSPKFRGNVGLGWNDARWAVDAYVHYVSAYDAYAPTGALVPTPTYVTLAGRIGYQISDGLIVAVSAKNLTTERQIQGVATGLQAPRQVLVSMTKSW